MKNVIKNIFGKIKKNRKINVRFPNFAGDSNRMMTVQELKEEYMDYLIVDPRFGKQIKIEDIDIDNQVEEVIVIPPITGG